MPSSATVDTALLDELAVAPDVGSSPVLKPLLAELAAREAGAFHAAYRLAQAEAETPAEAAQTKSAAPAVDSAQAIKAGREALGSRWRGYPWYDSSHDDLQRVRVPRTSNWNPNWSFSLPSDALKWVVWTVVALALVVLAYLLYQVYQGRWVDLPAKSRTQAERPLTNDASRVEALPFQLEPQAGSLLDAARRAYAAGDFARAIVYLFSHELVELDRRQHIRLTRGKTNRQYLRELGRGPLSGLLGQTMVAFEEVFFGNRALTRERFEICWNRLNEFDALLGPRR
ncbi:MAG: hypothetical protein K2Y37_24060 [Pirellulales bacterium]|nr:hypothetical protein [Pirellulales bacterium]